MTGADVAVLLTALAAIVGALGAFSVARARARRIVRDDDAWAAAVRREREDSEVWAVLGEHSERLAALEAESKVRRRDAQEARRASRSSSPSLPPRRIIEAPEEPPIILDNARGAPKADDTGGHRIVLLALDPKKGER